MERAREGPLTSVAEFCSHAATIAELQWKLFTLDVEDATRGSSGVLVGMGVSACVMLSALGLALHGAAEYWALTAEISRASAMLGTAIIALVAAAIVGFATLVECRRRRAIFHRSQEELRRNLATLRRAIDEYAARTSTAHLHE